MHETTTPQLRLFYGIPGKQSSIQNVTLLCQFCNAANSSYFPFKLLFWIVALTQLLLLSFLRFTTHGLRHIRQVEQKREEEEEEENEQH